MDYKEYVNTIYKMACYRGICASVTEFAEQLEMNRSGVSSALNGNEKYLTKSFIKKVRAYAKEHGLEEEDGVSQNTTPKDNAQEKPPIVIPAETMAFYTNLTESIRLLSETICRMQEKGVHTGIPTVFPDTRVKK